MSARDDLLRFSVALSTVYLAASLIRAFDRDGVWTDALLGAIPFVLTLIVAIATRRAQPQAFLPTVWPIAAWPLVYDGAVRVVSLAPERFIDGTLVVWDRALIHPNYAMPPWPLGGPLEELANLFYTSFYVVIPLGFAWAWRARGPQSALQYATATFGALCACALIWLVVPAGGYYAMGSPDSPAYGPFTAIARQLYEANPHFAAAFPSSHVALSFAAAGMLVMLGASRLWLLWAAMVAWGTVYGQYHYFVDSPPAVLIGLASVAFAVRHEVSFSARAAAPAASRP